jgi:hypothetical protein
MMLRFARLGIVAAVVCTVVSARHAAAQDIKSIERELRKPSRDRVIRDDRDTKRTNTDWQQSVRTFERRLTDQAREEQRDVQQTTRRVRTELDEVVRGQQRELDLENRRVETESRNQRTATFDTTRSAEQAASERLSERIRDINRTRNDERQSRRQMVLKNIQQALVDVRSKNRRQAETEKE